MRLCVRVDEEIGRRWKVVAVAAMQRSPSKSRRRHSCTTHTDTTGLPPLPPPLSKNSSRESKSYSGRACPRGCRPAASSIVGKNSSFRRNSYRCSSRTYPRRIPIRIFFCRQTVGCCAASLVSVTGIIVSHQRYYSYLVNCHRIRFVCIFFFYIISNRRYNHYYYTLSQYYYNLV